MAIVKSELLKELKKSYPNFLTRDLDKILEIIDKIDLKKIVDLKIIILANNLEKRSKLRVFFEKHKIYLCIPFYPDNNQTLSKIAYNFFKECKIVISSENINLIISRCNGDRENLQNELNKIKHFSRTKKNITRDWSRCINWSIWN